MCPRRNYGCDSLRRNAADSHLAQSVGDRRHGPPQYIGANRANAPHAEGVHGGQLARVQDESALAHPPVELGEVVRGVRWGVKRDDDRRL